MACFANQESLQERALRALQNFWHKRRHLGKQRYFASRVMRDFVETLT
jgi:hypothetical protein